ncbi:MAG: 3-hydroxybutyrate dehydrogenase [Deltaproteobacteria bacterium]|nr:3-hydroxybutyrate dehydrogenase [Deltaproteobacteria bacterium]
MGNPQKSELGDKIAIVTGAASGIGWNVAMALARKGAKVVLSDLNEKDGRAIEAETGGLFVRADLSRRADCAGLVDEAMRRFGKVDILVNNAGFQHVSPIERFSEDMWNQMISVMLTAPFLLTRYVWPSMKAQGRGRIVNVASIHGLVASPCKPAYITAKHGLLGFTKAAALEGGAHGITVNAICPAYVRTPLVDNQIADQAKSLGIPAEDVISKVMLGPAAIKHLIEPGEVAEMVLYLCSDAARSVTGASWTIDLGWTSQ